MVRRLYDWVLSLAHHPSGPWALFLLAVAESSVFPIPPDVLLIALCVGAITRSYRFALICTAGSVLGGMLGYSIGYLLWYGAGGQESAVAAFFFDHVPGMSREGFERLRLLYEQWNFWVVFTAGFTPIPYKVITITAGVFRIDFLLFLLASVVGRAGRFFLVAWLIHRYGAGITRFIDRWFNPLALAFTVLLVGGVLALKLLAH